MKKTVIMLAALMPWGYAGISAHVWDELAILARPAEEKAFELERYAYIQPTTYTNAIFFDYNNDGNLDLLVIGEGGDWNIPSSQKFVLLYENLGPDEDFRFRQVKDTGLRQARDEGFYNPVSAGDFNHDGYTDLLLMSYDGKRNVELYLNDRGTGHFILSEIALDGATNGSVMFGDLDNDGWLDIEFSGYGKSTPTALKLYLNNHDGTVKDASVADVTGAFQGQSTLADIDGDGLLDIISCGNGDGWVCLSSVYYNAGLSDGIPSWRKAGEAETGIDGSSRANPLVADFNNDGMMDIVVNGEPSQEAGYRTRIYYGTPEGRYSLDESYPVVGVNQDGGINMGDWNGDGNMDLIVGGFLGRNDGDVQRYSSPLRVYENIPSASGLNDNTRPGAPEWVTASYSDESGMLTIEWGEGSDVESRSSALRYNIYVRNETTGELYTMIPCDIVTGRVKVGTDLQTSLSSSVHRYEIYPFGSGNYTVGVQTLDQAYAGSEFATVSLDVSSVEAVCDNVAGAKVTVEGMVLNVYAYEESAVAVASPDGRIVDSAMLDGENAAVIRVPENGIYFVTVSSVSGKETFKVMVH